MSTIKSQALFQALDTQQWKSPCPLGAYNLIWGHGAEVDKYVVCQTVISALEKSGAGRELGCAGGSMQRHSFINAWVGHLCVAFLRKGLNLWL